MNEKVERTTNIRLVKQTRRFPGRKYPKDYLSVGVIETEVTPCEFRADRSNEERTCYWYELGVRLGDWDEFSHNYLNKHLSTEGSSFTLKAKELQSFLRTHRLDVDIDHTRKTVCVSTNNQWLQLVFQKKGEDWDIYGSSPGKPVDLQRHLVSIVQLDGKDIEFENVPFRT